MSSLPSITYYTGTSGARMNERCTIETVTAIWRRLLGRSTIAPNENFFSLGGNPQLANEVFREIAKLSGQELPAVWAFHAPTIDEMVYLANLSPHPPCPALLRIRQGTGRVAIFMAHGMGGDATQLFEIARHLEVTNPIYATQAPGIDGVSEPLSSVEKLADTYIRAIREVQPHGPYILIGYSFGGLVMLELARQLRAQGETVRLLAMLDSYPHRTHLSWKQQVPLLARLALRRLLSNLQSLRKPANEHARKLPADEIRERIHAAEFVAWKDYAPTAYPGNVLFLKAEVTSYFPADPRSIWEPLADNVELYTVPGDHSGLVERQYLVVASLLSQLLNRLPPISNVARIDR
jgi:acetoacetyl-CoA synthetase